MKRSRFGSMRKFSANGWLASLLLVSGLWGLGMLVRDFNPQAQQDARWHLVAQRLPLAPAEKVAPDDDVPTRSILVAVSAQVWHWATAPLRSGWER